jgi:hypothetical protein
LSVSVIILILKSIPSGLWHQWQARGQPLKNMVVLIFGPSWSAYRLIAKIVEIVAVIGFINNKSHSHAMEMSVYSGGRGNYVFIITRCVIVCH